MEMPGHLRPPQRQRHPRLDAAHTCVTLQPPDIAGGRHARLGIIASTLPLIDRITGPEMARNE